MKNIINKAQTGSDLQTKTPPISQVKIMEALRSLLGEKEFSAITWSEIAQTAGVNEGLIYRYFHNSRNLLHQVLKEYLETNVSRLKLDLRGIKGTMAQLSKMIWAHIYNLSSDRVFAKILLLEVRNYPGYFKSEAYEWVREYNRMMEDLIREGIENGEISKDVSPLYLRRAIVGAIEHFCLSAVIFEKEIDPDTLTEIVYNLLLKPIQKTSY